MEATVFATFLETNDSAKEKGLDFFLFFFFFLLQTYIIFN